MESEIINFIKEVNNWFRYDERVRKWAVYCVEDNVIVAVNWRIKRNFDKFTSNKIVSFDETKKVPPRVLAEYVFKDMQNSFEKKLKNNEEKI